ncbi:MAG: hypothetical protein U1F08_04375 [Steroidobacteraceae bacterium]
MPEPTESPDAPDDRRASVERLLMERARAQADREDDAPRDWLRQGVALAAALALVGVVLMGFDAFLTAMQKFMETQAVDPAPAPTEPVQAYAVEGEVSPPPPAGPGPRPSPPAPAGTSPATR